MNPAPLSSGRGRHWRSGRVTAEDFESCERLMYLELATDLENWPVRNLVIRQALDRAAQDLVALAGEAEPSA